MALSFASMRLFECRKCEAVIAFAVPVCICACWLRSRQRLRPILAYIVDVFRFDRLLLPHFSRLQCLSILFHHLMNNFEHSFSKAFSPFL